MKHLKRQALEGSTEARSERLRQAWREGLPFMPVVEFPSPFDMTCGDGDLSYGNGRGNGWGDGQNCGSADGDGFTDGWRGWPDRSTLDGYGPGAGGRSDGSGYSLR